MNDFTCIVYVFWNKLGIWPFISLLPVHQPCCNRNAWSILASPMPLLTGLQFRWLLIVPHIPVLSARTYVHQSLFLRQHLVWWCQTSQFHANPHGRCHIWSAHLCSFSQIHNSGSRWSLEFVLSPGIIWLPGSQHIEWPSLLAMFYCHCWSDQLAACLVVLDQPISYWLQWLILHSENHLCCSSEICNPDSHWSLKPILSCMMHAAKTIRLLSVSHSLPFLLVGSNTACLTALGQPASFWSWWVILHLINLLADLLTERQSRLLQIQSNHFVIGGTSWHGYLYIYSYLPLTMFLVSSTDCQLISAGFMLVYYIRSTWMILQSNVCKHPRSCNCASSWNPLPIVWIMYQKLFGTYPIVHMLNLHLYPAFGRSSKVTAMYKNHIMTHGELGIIQVKFLPKSPSRNLTCKMAISPLISSNFTQT